MIESIDQLRPGEYLMCARGPTVTGTDQRGRVVSRPDRTFEGSIVRVLAISPPMMLLRIFPMPCGDPNHDHTPYVTTVRFDYMGWSRPNHRYIREYMRAAHHKVTVKLIPQKAGVLNKEEFNKLMEDVYEMGGSPDGLTPGFPPDGDDDDDMSPTHE